MKKLILVFSILVFFNISCSTKSTSRIDNLKKLTPKLPNNALVVVIPKLGCSTCFHSARLFAQENIDNEKTFYIAVGFKSKKELGLEFGKKIVNSSNFIWDKEKKMFDWKLITNNPVYFIIKDNKIINSGKILPDNSKESIEYLINFVNKELK